MSEASGSVNLRPLGLDDMVRVLGWRNLPQVAAYMYTDHRISDAEHARWFATAMNDDTKRYWIIELDGEPVGLANLYDISLAQKRASVALYIARETARGAGVGSATDGLLISQAFEMVGLDKLCAEVLANNERGIRVHQRNGFAIDGVLRGHVLKAGVRVDVVTMSLFREQWLARAGGAVEP